MASKKWLLVSALTILLVISGAPALSTAVAQTNARGGLVSIPPNNRVGVVSVLPRNRNEFENIYGRRPSRTEVDNMIQTRVRLRQMNQPYLNFQQDARTSSGFENYVTQGEEQVLILAGHNVNGQFRFADGVSQNLAEIESTLRAHGKQAIYLSCDAKDHVPESPAATGTLWDRDVMRLTEALGNSLTGGGSASPDSPLRLDGEMVGRVQTEINSIEGGYGARYKIAIRAAEAAGAGGGLYVLKQQRKSKRR